MPKASTDFTLSRPSSELRAVLFDVSQLGQFFHPVDRVEGEAKSARWFLKAAMRATLGVPALEAKLLSASHEQAKWEARAEHLLWEGLLTLETLESNKTRIRLDLEIVDTGPLAAIHNAMISVQIKNVVKLFERNLREKLEV